MKKYLYSILLVFGLSGFFNSAWADSSPVNMLQSIANTLIANLKANKATLKTNPSLVYSLAYKIVVPHADLDEMSKRVLPPTVWNMASSSQRSQFKSEFTNLLVRTYASALADYTDQTVKFFPVRGGYQGKNNVRVDSQIIRADGPSLTVNYKLVLRDSQWKLYDLTVEGISLLESFRSQFADKVSQGASMNDLIRDLKQHNGRR